MFYTCCLIISLAVVPKEKTKTPKKTHKNTPKNIHTRKTRNNKKHLPNFTHTSITLFTHLTGIFFFKVKFQSAV